MATVPAQRVEVAGIHSTTSAPPVASMTVEKRRLIVACDGSWLNADSDATYIPSNIARLARALNTNATSPNPTQVTFYHRGLGANNDGKEDYYLGGYLGKDISEHVLECYSFLCTNYQEGDEVFIFGFSRGAYTARAISALISDVGLLTVRGLEWFYEIFEDWKNQNLPEAAKDLTDHHTPVQSGVFKGLHQRPKMPSAEYAASLSSRNLTRPDVTIKVLGVFDTVGALGLPPVFGIGKPSLEFLQYSFVNTKVSQVVEYAFQVLSLDDHRFSFMPCVWETPDAPNKLRSLQQCWFSGVHQNVGGGGSYPDQGLPNVSLAWMVQRLLAPDKNSGNPLLDFDLTYLEWVFQQNISHVEEVSAASGGDGLGFRGWALGKANESLDFKFSIAGNIKWHPKSISDFFHPGDVDRTPGRYEEWDASGGEAVKTGKMLKGTNEKIHSSARVRVARGGKGLDDKGVYAPRGLTGWKLMGDGDKKDPTATGFKWLGTDGDAKGLVLEEDVLGPFEAKLYGLSDKAFMAQAKGHK